MTFRGIDASKPNVARVCDALAGGRDNYAADRDEAQRLLEICPQLRAMVRENRAFLARAVTWAAGQGVRQFADLGAGLPAAPAVHEVAQDADPAARVAYVDRDPLVMSHLGALYRAGGHRGPAGGPYRAGRGPRGPGTEGRHRPGAARVPHLRPGAEPDARRAGPRGRGRVRAASRAGQLHAHLMRRCDDGELWGKLRAACTAAAPYNHTRRQIAGFLGGLEPVPPGLVPARNWRGGWRDVTVTPPGPAYVLAGAARKP